MMFSMWLFESHDLVESVSYVDMRSIVNTLMLLQILSN